MPDDGKFSGFNVKLFGDVFTDFNQIGITAFPTHAVFRLVADFNARQMIRQRLTACAWALRLGDCIARLLVSKLFDFRFDGQ